VADSAEQIIDNCVDTLSCHHTTRVSVNVQYLCCERLQITNRLCTIMSTTVNWLIGSTRTER